MRRFAFFDRDTVHSTILPCLDVIAASSGRGSVILGDSEGHLIFVNRDWGCTAIQAYKTRVNAIAQVKSCDVVVTIGDGADSRSSFQRSQARSFTLSIRKQVRENRENEVKKKQQQQNTKGQRSDSQNDDEDNNDEDNDNDDVQESSSRRSSTVTDQENTNNTMNNNEEENNEFSLAENNRDIGYIYGLGIPLEGVTSALVRGDSSWDSGSILPLPTSSPVQETLQPCATLKVWRLDKRDPRTGNPECVRTMKVFPSGPYGKDRSLGERIVTSLAVAEDLTQIAIGCGDGTVLLLRGDILKGGNSSRNSERNSRLGVAIGLAMNMGTNLKPQLLFEGTTSTDTVASSASSGTSSGNKNDTALTTSSSSGASSTSVYGMTNEAITYLSYTAQADPSLSSEPDTFAGKANGGTRSRHRTMLCLFATSLNRIRCYFPTEIRPLGMGRGWTPNEYIIELDDTGCIPGCASITDNGELVIGNDTGIFFYSYEERRASYVFPGRKQRLAWFRGYLVLAAEDSGMVGGTLGIGNVPNNNNYGRNNNNTSNTTNQNPIPSVTVTIYDLRSKYIAFGMSLGAAAAAASAGMRMNANMMNGRILGTVNGNNLGNIGQYVRYILCEWGTVFVLIGSGTLDNPYSTLANTSSSNNSLNIPPLSIYQLIEKDTGTKVEHLCRLHLFDMAASIAAAAHYGTDNLADIYKLHGDYLYSKGDYDGSVTQYVRTIGAVEPSYVIRRFLDSTRIMNLTTYLEALHAENKATVDHTTLLLNCYTKTKSQEKLRDFIRGEGNAAARKHPSHTSSAQTPKEGLTIPQTGTASSTLTFDVRVAIAVLRDAGCYSDALFLAEKQGEDDLVLAIMIEDGGKEEVDITARNTDTNTSKDTADGTITNAKSNPTNASVPPVGTSVVTTGSTTTNDRLRSGVLAAIQYIRRLPFIDAEFYIRQYGRSLVCSSPAETTEVICMLCTKWIRDKPYVAGTLARTANNSNKTNDAHDPFKKERTRVDSADVFLSLFVDQPLWLKRFCDYLITKANTNEVPKPSQAIWHSLLEVNLRKDSFLATVQATGLTDKDINDTAWDTWRDEVVLTGILRNLSANYDTPTALHFCSSHNYRNGIQYLYERLGMYPLVLASLMDAAETARSNGKHADAKAIRREIIRKAKQFTEASTSSITANPSSVSGTTGSSGLGTEGIAGIWVSILRYLARSYLSEQGTCVIPSSVPGQRPTVVSYPILSIVSSSSSALSSSTTAGSVGTTNSNAILTREREEQDSLMQDVLKHIDRTSILPALTVLTLLADCPHIPFGVLRDYITRRLTIETDKCNDDAKEIESFRTETEAMLNEINRLDTQPKLFQTRKCRLCNQDLELPSVHFMCGGLINSTNTTTNSTSTNLNKTNNINDNGSTIGTVTGEEHSFHQHCVIDAMNAQFGTGTNGMNDTTIIGGSSSSSSSLPVMECPICSYSQKQTKTIRASLGPRPGLSEQFYHELENSNDGFTKAADYLSKGIF